MLLAVCGRKLGKACLITLLSIIAALTSNAQSFHTVTFSGNSSDFNTAEKISAAANNTDYYITFDASNLYIAAFRTNSNTFGSTDNFSIYLDTDPNSSPTGGTGTTAGQAYNNVTPTLPFSANYNVHVEQGYQEARSFGSTWGSTISGVTYWTSSTAREAKIPFSSIGSPSALYISLFMGYNGGIFSSAPGADVAASGTPTLTNYFGGIGLGSANCIPVNIVNTPITAVLTNTAPTAGATYGKVSVTLGTVTAGGNFSIAPGGSISIAGGTLDISGVTVTMGASGTGKGATLSLSSGALTTSSSTVMNFVGDGVTSGTFTFNGTINLNKSFTPGSLTIGTTGVLNLNAGSFVSTNSPTYSTGATLKYNTGGTYVLTGSTKEWISGAASGAGVPSHVTIGDITNGTTLSFGTETAYRQATGNVTIAGNTSGLTLSTAIGGDLQIGGDWTNNGTFTHNSRAVRFNGSSAQAINTATTFAYLTLNNSGSTITPAGNITVANVTTLTSGKIVLGSNNFTTASLTGGSSTAYFVVGGTGLLKVTFSGTQLMPIGADVSTYSPVSITNSTSMQWSARIEPDFSNYPAINQSSALPVLWQLTPSTDPTATGTTLVFSWPTALWTPPASANIYHYQSPNGWTAVATGVTPTTNAGMASVTLTGQTQFSPFAISSTAAPLPVTLLRFSGKKAGDRNVLNWTTATEINNAGFQVQRSNDGVSFKTIGSVNSKAEGGNSQSDIEYSFSDVSFVGKAYYRLKQTDIDGRSRYSSIVVIASDKGGNLSIGGIYPNPTRSKVNVNIESMAAQNLTLIISDLSGRPVKMVSVAASAGTNSVSVDVSSLAAGSYFMKTVNALGEEGNSVKIIKQ